jgi:hypothetical protein
MALKYRQLYEDVLGCPSNVTMSARRLDDSSADARHA